MKLTRLVSAAAAVVLLAGCSPTPGTALVVDGTRYSENQITQISEACAEAMNISAEQMNRRGIVGTLLLGGLFDSFGADITDDQLQELGAQQGPESEQLFTVDECRPLALADVKVKMLGQLDQQFLFDGANGLDVQLNPRYGKWEPTSPELIDMSGSLSEPVAVEQ
ncbi:hypothetical protein [Tessaracoccus massiliensis]|uniref:hypothetical protein n=1 Tax=Tessaracoccus massiliensis TaxID=1522311 RepID=UPI00111A937F|nr:hypothetical protein [Tessaracoccus massiliensis]